MTTAPAAPGRIGERDRARARPSTTCASSTTGCADAGPSSTSSTPPRSPPAAAQRGRPRHVPVAGAVEGGVRPLPADLRDLRRRPGAVEQERERISALIWGRLDGADATCARAGLAVSLPEACRLSDALAGAAADRAVAGARRRRQRRPDQGAPGPAGAAARPGRPRARDHPRRRHRRVEGSCSSALADVTARAQRGADVGGMLGPLEQRRHAFERDLIVGNARRRDARDQVIAAKELRADLEAREAALAQLAATCVRTVDPAPRYAVPDVDGARPGAGHRRRRSAPTGPGSTGSPARSRSRRTRTPAALAERTELVDLLDAYVAKARALGRRRQRRPGRPASARRATCSTASPTPMAVARQLVTTYQTWLQPTRPPSRHPKESA